MYSPTPSIAFPVVAERYGERSLHLQSMGFPSLVVFHQIIIGLSFDDDFRTAVLDDHHRRFAESIVIAGHGEVVRASALDGQNIAGLHFRNPGIHNQRVRLAVTSGDSDDLRLRRIRLTCCYGLIYGIVEGGSRIVAQPTIYGDVSPVPRVFGNRDLLDWTDFIQSRSRRPNDASPVAPVLAGACCLYRTLRARL